MKRAMCLIERIEVVLYWTILMLSTAAVAYMICLGRVVESVLYGTAVIGMGVCIRTARTDKKKEDLLTRKN